MAPPTFGTSVNPPWARVANFVKKPPLIVNVTYLELNGFNASMWVSWSLSDPKKSQCIDRFIQIHQLCANKHKNHIKFEVSLHFQSIWPTVRRCQAASSILPKIEWAIAPHPLPTRHLRPWAKLILICIWAFISIFDLLFQKPSLKRRPKRNFSQQGGHVRRNGDPPITWYQPPPRFGYVKYFRVFGVRTVFDLLMVFKDF